MKSKDDDVLKDTDSLGARVGRYAKTSTAVTKLAAQLAGDRFLGIGIDRQRHAEELMLSLGDIKGPMLKIAQLLATIPEALPKEYAVELQKLQSQAPAMGWPFVRRRMVTELGSDWQKKFASFEHQAAAAASLGQVHKAVAHDGRSLACKLQYPDMLSAINADLAQLKLFLSLFESYDKSVVTSEIQKEMAARLREELDYKLEAKHMRLYSEMLKDEQGVKVPELVPGLSTGRLLTSTWLEGKPVLDFAKAPQAVRNEIAINLFRAWYVPFYHYGVIHGDPHLGNYTVFDKSSINLLDFGCVRVFPVKFIGGVIDLYHALENGDRDLAAHAYRTWGFTNINNEMLDVLNKWAYFLYGPVLENKKRPIGVVTKGIYGMETAREVHKALRSFGGITIPKEFVFMDRAALGLGSVFLHLRSEVNWHKLFNELIEDFDLKKTEKRQKRVLSLFGLVEK